jgi:hypothetical protein
MDSQTTRWVVLAVLNVPLYLGLGWLFFEDWGGFFECVRFWFTPDWISMIGGELVDDLWGTTKLFIFIALCAGAVYGEYQLIFGKPQPEQVSQIQACRMPREA